MKRIEMVDLRGQYEKSRDQIDAAIRACLESTAFINGPQVEVLAQGLQKYLEVGQAIPCGNGTDALQIALMGLQLQPGDEVIVPAFTYVAPAEVIALLGLTPVMVDVEPDTFAMSTSGAAAAITKRTRAIVPVHLFGQCADMEPLLALAQQKSVPIIEDAAQAMGATYTFADGTVKMAGSMGLVGCTSFFPSKNLGCFGDGGAMFTNQENLGQYLRQIANHGQKQKYRHEVLGVNSRLDSLQAAILQVKLPLLDRYNAARQQAAAFYDQALTGLGNLQLPLRHPKCNHVFHQYTLRVAKGRDDLQAFLASKGIPSQVYYPIPLHRQEAYAPAPYRQTTFPVAEELCQTVLSLPMHTELDEEQLGYITDQVKDFFTKWKGHA